MNEAAILRFPQELQDCGKWFAYMQIVRHCADYDPVARFARSEVRDRLGSVEDVIEAFSRVSLNERREFAIFVLFQIRKWLRETPDRSAAPKLGHSGLVQSDQTIYRRREAYLHPRPSMKAG